MRMSLGYKPFAVAGVAITWDPATADANAILTNGNLTVTSSDGNYAGVRATGLPAAAKSIFEITVTSMGSFTEFGVTTLAFGFVLSTDGDGTYSNITYSSTGTPNFVSPAPAPYAPGDVLTFLINSSTNLAWVLVNGVSVAGDPVAETGGLAVQAFDFAFAGVSGELTANFGGTPFSYPVTGFTGWNG